MALSSPVGCTRTLPVGPVSEFKMAVASCSNYPQGFFHAYRDIAESNVDVVLHLGDYIYEYPVGYYTNPVAENQFGRKVEPEHEILVLEDYRMRHGLYRTDPDLQAAHAAHPWITVWDDHEMMNDTWRAGPRTTTRARAISSNAFMPRGRPTMSGCPSVPGPRAIRG